MSIGGNIRKYRKAKGLTRDELASLLNVKKKDIFSWEYGIKKPNEAQVYHISSFLDVSPEKIDAARKANQNQGNFNEKTDEQSDFSLKVITPLEEALKTGERLIWIGRPNIENKAGIIDFIQMAFGSIWLIMILISALRAVLFYPPAAILGAPIIIIAAYTGVSRFYTIKKQKRFTHYAITNERIIIRCDYKKQVTKSINLNDIRTVRIEEGNGGMGNIIFSEKEEPAEITRPLPQSPGVYRARRFNMPQNGFYGISNVSKVVDILRGILDYS
ncbi:MAG TPA: helix-turn-helix transcriptional regulator [Clostridia bacterium]|nr:helix-turn-helix transcriptional regulator [Clostridia bacterium]